MIQVNQIVHPGGNHSQMDQEALHQLFDTLLRMVANSIVIRAGRDLQFPAGSGVIPFCLINRLYRK